MDSTGFDRLAVRLQKLYVMKPILVNTKSTSLYYWYDGFAPRSVREMEISRAIKTIYRAIFIDIL